MNDRPREVPIPVAFAPDMRPVADDLWCAIFKDIEHRDKTIDTDGDGVTDYDEMVLWRDPMVKGPPPRKLTPEEIEEGKRKAEEAKQRQGLSIIISCREPAPPLQVEEIVRTGAEEFTLTWRAVVGKRYSVETSTDLQTWMVETGQISAIQELVASPVAAPKSDPRRFYRVAEVE